MRLFADYRLVVKFQMQDVFIGVVAFMVCSLFGLIMTVA